MMSPKYNAYVYHTDHELKAVIHVEGLGPLDPEWYDEDHFEALLDEDFDEYDVEYVDEYEPPEFDDGD